VEVWLDGIDGKSGGWGPFEIDDGWGDEYKGG